MIKEQCAAENEDMDKFKEECGVFGIFSNKDIDASRLTYYGLYALQHRGQESAGIAVSNGKELCVYKNMGLVADVFNPEIIDSLVGSSAIGHVRYSTTGGSNANNAQPIMSNFKLGSIAIAHNGNLVNADVIRELLQDGGTMFQTSIDTEVILNLIARAAKKGIEKAVVDAIQAIKGSYAIVILTKDKLIGVRDPNGIRPLCIGKIDDSYIICSESCALDTVGAEFVRDVNPGEIVIVDKDGLRSINFAEKTKCETCAFEYIYFARPDSVIDGIDVNKSRELAGEQLFKDSPVEADIVIGVPDSGIPAAIGYARASGIPYTLGLIKNKYIGRTFIAPTQELREKAVSVKLNPVKSIIEGKRVVLIDDSIVRGTTSKRLVDIIRKAGAKEVHFRVSSPIVKFPCYFGIDTPYRKDLIGAHKTVEEIRDFIGADSLGYLSIDALLKTLGKDKKFCLGCFNGVYPVSAPVEADKDRLET
ncbi:amidophosphoribosyltransferase [Clostridium acetobutylicum]|uniref:Amidophosphoribosyltransferase n=1 Tax=Clostridium acetobutylicum (strain ATCC 824 / DSM 792 / JCM 1419 / IAM 19013 / LMG 5710 / NBRC 13948 / NRRL B-527 / VKM B-1787 / 2291 / W) TaxID=272562 RepID=Q97J94_CLOAB|nr:MULTISPECIES: amidophosphoribosyltransferase [Clostridium]AAK79360.1 Glutamine phosphoribosylpyrophosphate amidotransferase [Clostridium acetobutylicum ATCC 824]ADZ20444.1 amidophosphoribosyltransferase [Clostridium acetobutylicum EA 2018]AEI33903.1 amidophosphoribosyltransferase [Clostridium acetobutylicum DSM 1731]AWV81391.1 amidophosphoribosyltransferase [Clostridium acetobutylicum]MBC2393025.1 amidophosphoribosyltransferase [Clostridium acetobutylicum]